MNSLCCCALASDVFCHPWRWSCSRAVQLIRRVRTATLGQFRTSCWLVTALGGVWQDCRPSTPAASRKRMLLSLSGLSLSVLVCVCFLRNARIGSQSPHENAQCLRGDHVRSGSDCAGIPAPRLSILPNICKDLGAWLDLLGRLTQTCSM